MLYGCWNNIVTFFCAGWIGSRRMDKSGDFHKSKELPEVYLRYPPEELLEIYFFLHFSQISQSFTRFPPNIFLISPIKMLNFRLDTKSQQKNQKVKKNMSQYYWQSCMFSLNVTLFRSSRWAVLLKYQFFFSRSDFFLKRVLDHIKFSRRLGCS